MGLNSLLLEIWHGSEWLMESREGFLLSNPLSPCCILVLTLAGLSGSWVWDGYGMVGMASGIVSPRWVKGSLPSLPTELKVLRHFFKFSSSLSLFGVG